MKRRGWLTRSQRWFLLLVVNLALLILGTILLSRHTSNSNHDAGMALESLSSEKSQASSQQYYAVEEHQPASFSFDPNEADSTQLLSLGLAPFQVRSIYRYRAKGGRFSTKEDFRRVYRLTNEQWEHLSPLITIDKKYQLVELPQKQTRITQDTPNSQEYPSSQNPQTTQSTQSTQSPTTTISYKLTGDETIDINTADSALLCRVPGIGPYFSKQIIRYRKQLGGYISTEQLLQIDNFPVQAIAWLEVTDTTHVRRLNINTLTTRQLMKHPYIGYYRAADIVNYRRIHGPFQNLNTLLHLEHFTLEDLNRLKPYLVIND